MKTHVTRCNTYRNMIVGDPPEFRVWKLVVRHQSFHHLTQRWSAVWNNSWDSSAQETKQETKANWKPLEKVILSSHTNLDFVWQLSDLFLSDGSAMKNFQFSIKKKKGQNCGEIIINHTNSVCTVIEKTDWPMLLKHLLVLLKSVC